MTTTAEHFVGDNLWVARIFRGLTQDELGKRVFASTASIWQLENNIKEPSPDLLEAIAHELGFEPAFFLTPLPDPLKEEQCNFRHRKTASQRTKKRVLAHGSLVVLAIQYLRSSLDLPRDNVPHLTAVNHDEIEHAAEHCRAHWGLGIDAPISHVGRVLENAGVVVVRHREDTQTIDAFSRFGLVSVVVLNTIKLSASRTLFDMGHELGHLVMHTAGSPPRDRAEREADRFASAFLMPRRAFSREVRAAHNVDWPHLFALKLRWRTSLAAIVRRAWDLGLIPASSYRYFNQQIRIKGWHRGEPHEPEPEQPELLSLAFATMEEELGQTPVDVARALHWTPQTLSDVLGITVSSPSDNTVISIDSRRKSS